MRTALVYAVVALAVVICVSDAHAKDLYWNGTDWLLWWIRR